MIEDQPILLEKNNCDQQQQQQQQQSQPQQLSPRASIESTKNLDKDELKLVDDNASLNTNQSNIDIHVNKLEAASVKEKIISNDDDIVDVDDNDDEEESINSCNNSNDTHRSQSSNRSNASPTNEQQTTSQQNEEQQQQQQHHHRAPTSNSSQSGGSINGDQMHTCKLCDKQLSSSSSLDRHMLTHSGERPFKCKRCSMTFTTNGNMHRHMRTHLHKDSLAQQKKSLATATTAAPNTNHMEQQAPTSNLLASSITSGNNNSRLSSKSDQHQIESVIGEQKQQQQQQIKQRRRKIRSTITVATTTTTTNKGGSKVKEDLVHNDCYDDDATIISSDNDSGCNEDNLLLTPNLRNPPIKKRKQNHPSYKGSQSKNDLHLTDGLTETATTLNLRCQSSVNMKHDGTSTTSKRDRENFILNLNSNNNNNNIAESSGNHLARDSLSEEDVDDDRSESNLTRSDEGGDQHTNNLESRPNIVGQATNCDQSISGHGHNIKKNNFDEDLLSILNYEPLRCFFANDNTYTQINDFHDLNTKEHFHTIMSDETTKMQLASMVAAAAQLNNPFIHGTNNNNNNNLTEQAAIKLREQQLQFATQMLKNLTDGSLRHSQANEFYCYQCKVSFPSREISDKHFKLTHLGNLQSSNYGQSTTSRKSLAVNKNDQLCPQTDLPWSSSTVMAAATAAALANLQNLPSATGPNIHQMHHQQIKRHDLDHQHASPCVSPQSQPDNGIEYTSKNSRFIDGLLKQQQTRKHTSLSRKVKVEEEEQQKIYSDRNQDRHLINQTGDDNSSSPNDLLMMRDSPQQLKQRSDSTGERVLWVRSDSQYSQRSANEGEINEFVAKGGETNTAYGGDVFDDLISNSSRSMNKFEDDNNNDHHHLHRTKDLSVNTRATQLTSNKADRQLNHHQDDHHHNNNKRKQQATATCFPFSEPGNVSEIGSAGFYNNKSSTTATEPTTTTTTNTTTTTASTTTSETTEEIGQNYVKTANPNATRKGGKRNRHCYKCKLCTYSSVDRCTLVRHLRIHSGERPYICMICRYAFTTKANCERHVRKRHKKQYNSLGGSGDGVKGSNTGGRSLIITDHSNHQTIPVKVSANPAAGHTGTQSHKTTTNQSSHGSSSSNKAPNTSTKLSSVPQQQKQQQQPQQQTAKIASIKNNNHYTYDNQTTKLTTPITKGSHQSQSQSHLGLLKQARKSNQHNHNDSSQNSNQLKHERTSEPMLIGGFKLGERGTDRNNHMSTTTIKNHQTLQDQCISLSTSPSSHLILNFDHFGQKRQQQSHPIQFVNNESQRLRLPFDIHRPLDLAAQALDLSCKFQAGR